MVKTRFVQDFNTILDRFISKNVRFGLLSVHVDVDRRSRVNHTMLTEYMYVVVDRRSRVNHTMLTEYMTISKRKKEEIWLGPMTKAPTPTEMSKGKVTT